MKHSHWIAMAVVLSPMIVGCDDDERLAEFARESAAQQADQNQATAQLAREATENQRRMVQSVEQSRQDLVALQQDMEKQRQVLNGQPRDLATERYGESLLVPVLSTTGLLLVTALPLVLCWYLLHTLQHDSADDQQVSQLLIQELVTEQPVLLSVERGEIPRLEHASLPTQTVIDRSSCVSSPECQSPAKGGSL